MPKLPTSSNVSPSILFKQSTHLSIAFKQPLCKGCTFRYIMTQTQGLGSSQGKTDKSTDQSKIMLSQPTFPNPPPPQFTITNGVDVHSECYGTTSQ